MNRSLSSTLALAFLALIVFSFAGNFLTLYIDWLWFSSVGYRPVFTTILKTQVALGAAFGLVLFAVFMANLAVAGRFRSRGVYTPFETILGIPQWAALLPHLGKWITGGTAILALFAALKGSTEWRPFLLALYPTPFGQTDPLFGKDYAFYVFQLPFLRTAQNTLAFDLIAASILTAGVYVIRQGIHLRGQQVVIDPKVRAHLLILAAAVFFVSAWGYRLDVYDLLYSQRGVVSGALYADVHARLPAFHLLTALSVLDGVICLVWIGRSGWLVPLGAAASVLIVSFGGGSMIPELVHRFQVVPNEIELERPYIAANIQATRFSYGLHRITEENFPSEDNLSKEDLAKNALTIKNIRLWDHRPLLSTYRQLQQIRNYYDFVDIDNDRYTINGEYRQTMISPRELSPSSQSVSSNWINAHLTYTHGYGVAFGPVNRVTGEGLPDFMIKDIPPASTTNVEITRPEIYFGESPNDYVFVRTRAAEFDYPKGDKNVFTTYDGKDGVPVSSSLRKLLLAARFGSLKIFLNNDISNASRVLFYRNITDRVSRIAPFLQIDRDPYMVITSEGRLIWIVDCYTTTDGIPYAQPAAPHINYIRNAAKAVVDAYDGTVVFYISDPEDALIRAYAQIFPGIFRPMSTMPADVRNHLRYPQDMFNIQAHLFTTYHMQDPQIFFNKEDLWTIPKKGEQDMEPYYTVMKLPGGKREEFILMIPFTPAKRDNMTAWLAARADGEEYGRLIVYLFPKQKLIYGPRQIEARIDQDAYISQQLSLWNQRGSQVIRGSLLVIPIEKSLIYVEPLYLAAEAGGLPELRRVIVAFGNQVVMDETLDGALSAVFGGKTIHASIPAERVGRSADQPSSLKSLADEALQHFNRAQERQRSGDWSGYGQELELLGETLKRLRDQSGK